MGIKSQERSTSKPKTDSGLLLPQHQSLLSESAISSDVATARGYRSVKSVVELKRLGFKDVQCRVPALLIPVHDVNDEIATYQSRPDEARIGRNGRRIKYEIPAGSRVILDVPPGIREKLRDPAWPLFITEGIRKADSAVSHCLCCIALLGVWNWRGTNEVGGKTALPDWEQIALNRRLVYVVFDSDIMHKAAVHTALIRLKAFLESRGARVKVVYLPGGEGVKIGLDDFLAAGHDVAELEALASEKIAPLKAGEQDSTGESKYTVLDGQICRRHRTNESELWLPLCNFTAYVSEEVELDDGAETSRFFVIDGALASGQPLKPTRVPVDQFSSLAWVPKSWGLAPVVGSGLATRDQLREAIQLLSPEARFRKVYTHTGWRKIDDNWVYLSNGVAIGADGMEVELGPELARFALPTVIENPAEAMRRSLALLRIAPRRVTAALWAGTFRAVLATVFRLDCFLWLEGRTGSLKSTLAALFQSHYGEFERTTLPGDWRTTANALEKRAFTLKDALFVIDEYVPNQERREFEQKAARLIRAQGNLSGRGRLRQDLSERPAYPPRGLILATGEEHPPGQSIMARTLVLELQRHEVDLARLSEAQMTTAFLPHATAGFIAWLVPQIDTLRTTLPQIFEQLRASAGVHGHLRVPEVLSHLGLGLDIALSYAVEVGACNDAQRGEIQEECWTAMLEAAKRQGQLIEQEQPVRRFLEILNTLLVQGAVVVVPKDNGLDSVPANTTAIGWEDAGYLYLLPDSAYQVVSKFSRDAGEQFPISKNRLLTDLVQEKVAESATGRNTVLVRLGGAVHRVLKLKRSAIEEWVGVADETNSAPDVTAVTDVTGLGR